MSLGKISKALKHDAILGLPSLNVNMQMFCKDCQWGKQIRKSHKLVGECYTSRVLELLHTDLMGPM